MWARSNVRTAYTSSVAFLQQQEVVKIKVALGEGEPDMELRYRKGTDPAEAAETFIKVCISGFIIVVSFYLVRGLEKFAQGAV